MRIALIALATSFATSAAADPPRSGSETKLGQVTNTHVQNIAGIRAPSSAGVSMPLHGQLTGDPDAGGEIAEEPDQGGEIARVSSGADGGGERSVTLSQRLRAAARN